MVVIESADRQFLQAPTAFAAARGSGPVLGAVLVCPNYLGQLVAEAHISSAAERAELPVRNFVGTKHSLCAPGLMPH